MKCWVQSDELSSLPISFQWKESCFSTLLGIRQVIYLPYTTCTHHTNHTYISISHTHNTHTPPSLSLTHTPSPSLSLTHANTHHTCTPTPHIHSIRWSPPHTGIPPPPPPPPQIHKSSSTHPKYTQWLPHARNTPTYHTPSHPTHTYLVCFSHWTPVRTKQTCGDGPGCGTSSGDLWSPPSLLFCCKSQARIFVDSQSMERWQLGT